MREFEVVVRDAAGFVFTFTYNVRSATAARAEFHRRARRNGVTKFKNIKILEVNQID